MTGEVELADEDRNRGVFPRSWGPPRGSTFSDERRAWVANNVRRHVLARRQTPAERIAYLERKRRTP